MINRRHLRIKVMQLLYSCERTENPDYSIAKKNLLSNIENVYRTYLYILLFIEKIAEFVEVDRRIKASKYLRTEEDKNFNPKIYNNIFIRFLREHSLFNQIIKNEKLARHLDETLIRNFYNELKKADAYKKYLVADANNRDEELKIMLSLFKQILLPSETFHHHLEDISSGWMDDKDVIIQTIINNINDFSEETLSESIEQTEISHHNEEKSFASDLFRETLLHEKELKDLISPKLVNWDVDRISQIDLILMKMALCEMLHFYSIPVKVSINEYIDISKTYSTPKSKEFINGILDNIMKGLKEGGLIKKQGRGLVE